MSLSPTGLILCLIVHSQGNGPKKTSPILGRDFVFRLRLWGSAHSSSFISFLYGLQWARKIDRRWPALIEEEWASAFSSGWRPTVVWPYDCMFGVSWKQMKSQPRFNKVSYERVLNSLVENRGLVSKCRICCKPPQTQTKHSTGSYCCSALLQPSLEI